MHMKSVLKNKIFLTSIILFFVSILSLLLLKFYFIYDPEDGYQKGLVALGKGNPDLAYIEFLKAAEKNHVESIYGLGALYRDGLGVLKSADEAAKWYLKAAELNFAPAQFNLAVMHQKGEGVPFDNKIAIQYYYSAASQGYSRAQFNLAVMYQRGIGTRQDLVEAFLWYGRAANQGDKEAESRMILVSENIPASLLTKARETLKKEFNQN